MFQKKLKIYKKNEVGDVKVEDNYPDFLVLGFQEVDTPNTGKKNN